MKKYKAVILMILVGLTVLYASLGYKSNRLGLSYQDLDQMQLSTLRGKDVAELLKILGELTIARFKTRKQNIGLTITQCLGVKMDLEKYHLWWSQAKWT